ncbi:hypothetical protein IJ674_10335 [bacterium]|nr:hypothetical protein [bacterium]
MNTTHYGSIWHKTKWKTIFEYLPTKEHNEHKMWWIEKVYKNNKIFSHYQLACEEGYKNKIPTKFNEYIKSTFKDDRYITELKTRKEQK